MKRLNLGDLNPIYERELNKLDVCQVKGRRNVSRDGEGGRHKYPGVFCPIDDDDDDHDFWKTKGPAHEGMLSV